MSKNQEYSESDSSESSSSDEDNIERKESPVRKSNKSYDKKGLPLENPKLIRNKKIIENVEVLEKPKLVRSVNDGSVDKSLATSGKKNNPLVKEKVKCSEAKMLQMKDARQIRSNNALAKRVLLENEQKVLQTLLSKELGAKYENSRAGKLMETKLKREIIEKLKKQKIAELKLKYNYQSDEELSDSESEIEEERLNVTPRKEVAKPINKPLAEIKSKVSVIDYIKKYGF
jgi:hypothetical protein